MLTKFKLLVIGGALLVGIGVAAAENGPGSAAPGRDPAAWKAKRGEMKAKMLAKYDTNKDGKLDDGEKKVMRDEKTAERFKKLDTDGNGSLSLDEFRSGQARMFKHHGRRGHAQGRKRGGSDQP
jgi:hypothetical protein